MNIESYFIVSILLNIFLLAKFIEIYRSRNFYKEMAIRNVDENCELKKQAFLNKHYIKDCIMSGEDASRTLDKK